MAVYPSGGELMSSFVRRFCVAVAAMAAVAGLGAVAAPAASAASAEGPMHRVPDDICASGRTDLFKINSGSAPNGVLCFADSGTLGVYITHATCVAAGINMVGVMFSDGWEYWEPGQSKCWGGEREIFAVTIVKPASSYPDR
jgi:hypothetical protein